MKVSWQKDYIHIGRVLLCGHREKNIHHCEVTLILSKEVDETLLEWEAVSSRIIIEKPQEKVSMNVIQCHTTNKY